MESNFEWNSGLRKRMSMIFCKYKHEQSFVDFSKKEKNSTIACIILQCICTPSGIEARVWPMLIFRRFFVRILRETKINHSLLHPPNHYIFTEDIYYMEYTLHEQETNWYQIQNACVCERLDKATSKAQSTEKNNIKIFAIERNTLCRGKNTHTLDAHRIKTRREENHISESNYGCFRKVFNPAYTNNSNNNQTHT